MKFISLAIGSLAVLLLAFSLEAQDKPGGGPRHTTRSSERNEPPPDYHRPEPYFPSRPPGETADSEPKIPNPGIGVCLIGEKYTYLSDPVDADKCDAVMWTNMVMWADNQRKLIDQSTLVGEPSATTDGGTICRSCSGTCQTISLPVKDSNYDDVEAGGGQSPSECLASIREICESGSYRHFTSARCGN